MTLFTFHLLPELPKSSLFRNADMIRCFLDSLFKSKLMVNVIRSTSLSGKNNFFEKFVILICSTQLNKYIFERFLINSRDPNSIYRNISITLCFVMFSSNFITPEILKHDGIIIATTLTLFIGYYMDTWHSPKTKLRPKRQGQFKLQRNAKA